ncbi:hypothetical protein [Bradyrhizobium sp.]|uniref:hypothetical protein n=1 Tax=Bradyrhizobium sp. TaxID=376 RepID=UPI002626A456|nr:hypothetical protein [Bradyrhizobium sp.]
MPKYLRLIAPSGCDEANEGTNRYRVDLDGTVVMPFDVAQHFLHNVSGFVLAPEGDQPPEDWTPKHRP